MIQLMKLFASHAPRRELSVDRTLPPLVLYTDASDVPGRVDGRWIVGAVLVDPLSTTQIEYTAWVVPNEAVDSSSLRVR